MFQGYISEFYIYIYIYKEYIIYQLSSINYIIWLWLSILH